MATTRVAVRQSTRAVLAVYAASLPLPALSLGLGDIAMQSFLNEPLRAQVELLDVRDLAVEDIRIRLAEVEDFERIGVDRSYFLTSIRFDVSLDPATGRGVIRLSTPEAVLEPYLDLIIEARWPQGRVLREYTVLVDPPAFRREVITVSASERVQATRPDKPAVREEPDSPRPETHGTGTDVAVRPSSLPPGEMPERAFSADTAPLPRAGNRYMVRRDETLWQIASVARPENVSVQQSMLDIQRLNPEAFIDGNINRIKAGYIIYLPAAGEVDSDDLAAALEEVRAQNRAFAEVTTPGVSAAATLRVSADTTSVTGDDEEGEQPRVLAPTAADTMEAGDNSAAPDAGSRSEVPGGVAAGGGTGTAPELAAQLAAVSERLDTLEQIVSLRDEQIATLEQALREAREAAAASAAVPPTAPSPATPTRSLTPSPAATPPVPWLAIGGGVIAVLLALLLFFRRRASSDATVADAPATNPAADEQADVFRGVSLTSETLSEARDEAPQAASAATSGVAKADELSRGGSRGYGERKNDDYIDDGAARDALAEADIYIAYGRYLQAIELLDSVIENEPHSSAYRLKLIELYVDMGEEGNALAQLEALRERGDADAIARAEALLGAAAPINGDNTVDTLPGADESHEAHAVDASNGPGEDFDLDLDLGEPDLQVDLEEESEPQAQIARQAEELLEEPSSPAAAIGNAVDTSEPLEFDQLEIEDDVREGDAGDDTLDLEDIDAPEEILDLTDALPEFSSARPENTDVEEDDDELLIADDADQMATKLDLARAYMDMGDGAGARGILEEVADSASGELQQEARQLLERLG